jgi:hypothetical protein
VWAVCEAVERLDFSRLLGMLRSEAAPGERSLAVKRPDLARELHPIRDHDLDPYALAAGSSQSVWWRCRRCGHEWQTTVHHRKGCPACARRRLSITNAAASSDR